MKRIITLTLALVLLCCCLSACGGTDVDLSGRWESVVCYDSASVLEELEALEFYKEEIALLDPAAMGFSAVLLLNEDMTYTMTCDPVRSMELVEEYYRSAFATFYANRESLQDLYGEDFASMSEEEFYQYYAGIYGAATFDVLIDMIVGDESDYAYLAEDAENGTYRITLNRIFFTIDGTSAEEFVTFNVVEDNTLTLEYEDYTVVYTKAE